MFPLKRTPSLIWIALFVLLSFQINAQTTDKPILKVAPLNLLDPFGSNLLVGAEFIRNEAYSFEMNVGILLPSYDQLSGDETPKIKDRYGIKIKPEFRSYFRKRGSEKASSGKAKYKSGFVAYEPFITAKKVSIGNTYSYTPAYPNENYQTFFGYETIAGYQIGSNVKWGYQRISPSGFTFEVYLGFGGFFYNYKYIEEVAGYRVYYIKNMFGDFNYTGKNFRPNITFGLKFGFQFKEKSEANID